MGLDSYRTIDAIGTDKETGVVVLTIEDSWSWANEDAHLRALQAKLNTYFEYIASGKFVKDYPQGIGRPFRLDIIARCEIPVSANPLLNQARHLASTIGFPLIHRVLPQPPPE